MSSGPEKRRRRTTGKKIAIVQQSFEPGMTVSPRCPATHGQPAVISQRKQYQEEVPLSPPENRLFLPLWNLLPP